jgi:hypothetical protein
MRWRARREAAQPSARIAVPAPEHACRYDGKSLATLVALRLMPHLDRRSCPKCLECPAREAPAGAYRPRQCEGLPLCEGLPPVFDGQVLTKRYSLTLMVRLRPPLVVPHPDTATGNPRPTHNAPVPRWRAWRATDSWREGAGGPTAWRVRGAGCGDRRGGGWRSCRGAFR